MVSWPHHQPFFFSNAILPYSKSSNLNLKNEVIFGIFNHKNPK
jgi:hypothetical protein